MCSFFRIVPVEPYKRQIVKELFDLVKRGRVKKVETILMEKYVRSQVLLKKFYGNVSLLHQEY